jgi:hypothetical protein
MDNQPLVIDNQSLVIDNQPLVMDNQSLVIDNETLVIDNQSLVIDNETLVIDNQSLVMDNQSLVVHNQRLAIDDNSLLIDDKALVIDDKNIVMDEEAVVIDEENLAIDDEALAIKNRYLIVDKYNAFIYNEVVTYSRKEYFMASNTDYIPRKDGVFVEFSKVLYAYALTNFARWQIPSPQPTLEALLTDYEAKFVAAKNPNRGRVDILNKNNSRDNLKKATRVYCKAYLLYNPSVTDEDRQRMGLPVYTKSRSPVPVPKSVPVLTVHIKNPRELLVYYHDSETGKRGKPVNVHGVEILVAILDHFPTDIEKEFNQSVFDTSPPCALRFAEYERGKRVYLCGRWEIQREGEKGPLGEIIEAVIP